MRLRLFLLACLAVVALGACSNEPELDVVLSPAAEQGRAIANSSGCASCHGKNGQGVTAPSWQGLYGDFVPLKDNSTVTADDDYLYRSITDPSSQLVRDWNIKMPTNNLSDDEIVLVIQYIKELG